MVRGREQKMVTAGYKKTLHVHMASRVTHTHSKAAPAGGCSTERVSAKHYKD